MSAKMKSLNLIATFLLLATGGTQGRSEVVSPIAALCEANPICSHGVANGEGHIVLRLRTAAETKTIFCDGEGKCEMLLPRGQRMSIRDIPAILLAK
jgi:hypothetical protein